MIDIGRDVSTFGREMRAKGVAVGRPFPPLNHMLRVTIGTDYGGMGLGHLAKTIIIEELSRVSGAMGAMVQASQLGVAKILHYGDDTQKKTWLPAVADGTCLPTIAVTEPQSGGHVLGMTATAVRDGDDYIINGRKVFVGNSHVGNLHGVVVRTGSGSKGLSAFLVESAAKVGHRALGRPAEAGPPRGLAQCRHDPRIPARWTAQEMGGDSLRLGPCIRQQLGGAAMCKVSLGRRECVVDGRPQQRVHESQVDLPAEHVVPRQRVRRRRSHLYIQTRERGRQTRISILAQDGDCLREAGGLSR